MALHRKIVEYLPKIWVHEQKKVISSSGGKLCPLPRSQLNDVENWRMSKKRSSVAQEGSCASSPENFPARRPC